MQEMAGPRYRFAAAQAAHGPLYGWAEILSRSSLRPTVGDPSGPSSVAHIGAAAMGGFAMDLHHLHFSLRGSMQAQTAAAQ